MAHGKASASPNDFILPDLGEGVHEGELISWKVEIGQAVKEGDTLAEFETDKALCEVASPRDGVIAQLHGTPGEILHVGNPLVSYVGDGGAASSGPKSKESTAGKSTAASSGVTSNGPSAAPQRSFEEEPGEDAGTVVGKMSGAAAGVAAEPGKALATPAVRRLARDLGVNIDAITGTGIGGRVTEKDVRGATGRSGAEQRRSAPEHRAAPSAPPRPSHVSAPAPSRSTPPTRQPSSFPEGQDTLRIPFRGVRRTIAARLRESVNQAVHFNVMDEADVSALDTLRRKLAAASGEKISFLPFVASAICRVLTHPTFRAMNSTVDEKGGDPNYDASIIQHRAVHMGIATDTDSGLMVPVIRECDALGVLEIGRHITRIAGAARDRSIARDELMGSTFTISNVGSHAGRFATPIINYPEVGILAVGRARPSPVIRDGGIFIGNLLPLSLACDHRVVDGATAALALAKIIEMLQDPEQLLGPARGMIPVLIWLIVQLIAAVLLVVLPFVMQAKESLHPPMNTPSLGTFGIVMMAAFYFIVAGFINGIIVGSRLAWPWYATVPFAIAAATVGAIVSYVLLYTMASKGGVAITVLGGSGLAALLAINVVGPRLV